MVTVFFGTFLGIWLHHLSFWFCGPCYKTNGFWIHLSKSSVISSLTHKNIVCLWIRPHFQVPELRVSKSLGECNSIKNNGLFGFQLLNCMDVLYNYVIWKSFTLLYGCHLLLLLVYSWSNQFQRKFFHFQEIWCSLSRVSFSSIAVCNNL